MLADDLVAGVRALLFSAECADVQLCVGDRIICAHSLVLRVRCPALLHACTVADGLHQSGALRLLCVPSTLTADEVEPLLRYVYTDELCASTSVTTRLQLLRPADAYSLPRLHALLVTSLTASLDIENAAHVYFEVAWRHLPMTSPPHIHPHT